MTLTKSEIDQLESKAKEILLSVFGDAENIEIPIKLEDVLLAYQVILKAGDFPTSDISGAYERATRTIFISDSEPYPRKAFTIAHEFGHIILHEHKDREIFYRLQILNIDKEDEKEETEANWFASALLMPEKRVREYWTRKKDEGELAKIFGVSYTAMHFRLKNLHII